MSAQDRVMLVTNDPETATAVASALESIGHLVADGVCHDLVELVAKLERNPATGVLVDIDPEPARILSELDPIISRFGDIRFIVLSSARREDLVLEAMQIGARHFLLKQAIAPALAPALERLMPRGSARGQRGAMITLLAASGGCGATTIAINLANELHLATSETALVVDLDTCYGEVGTYLGLEGRFGIDHVLADPTRIDEQLISSTALTYSKGLHVLASCANTSTLERGPEQYEHLGPALEACKRAYRYTVVDAPRVSKQVAAGLARASGLVLIVFQLNVKDIRTARYLLTALADCGVPADRIRPLANRFRKGHSMIDPKEAEAALGGIPLVRASNDFRSVMRGVNYGQPLAQAAPRSALRRDIRQLAMKALEAHLSA